MDIELSNDDLSFEAEVREFLAGNAYKDGEDPNKWRMDWFEKAREKGGWDVPKWPTKFGGPGWTPNQHYIWQKETARSNTPWDMPFGLSMLGPVLMAHFGWATWWETLGAIALLMALLFHVGIPRVAVAGARPPAANLLRLRLVWRTPQVWRVALAFACYSGQWLVIIGFLPTLLQTGGMSAGLAGTIAAIASAVNIVGNIAGGRLLQKGVPSQRVLGIAFATMAAGAFVVFGTPSDTPLTVKLVAVLMFSGVGGMIPGSLFSLAVRAAPTEDTASTALGWATQMSLLGQFSMPPIAAALATAHGSWGLTWVVTVSLCLIGILLTRQPTARA